MKDLFSTALMKAKEEKRLVQIHVNQEEPSRFAAGFVKEFDES